MRIRALALLAFSFAASSASATTVGFLFGDKDCMGMVGTTAGFPDCYLGLSGTGTAVHEADDPALTDWRNDQLPLRPPNSTVIGPEFSFDIASYTIDSLMLTAHMASNGTPQGLGTNVALLFNGVGVTPLPRNSGPFPVAVSVPVDPAVVPGLLATGALQVEFLVQCCNSTVFILDYLEVSAQVTPLPEPSTGLLSAIGLLGLATRRRRDRRPI